MMGCQCSAHITPAKQNNDKGKQREELLADMENSSFPAKFDNNENRALWKFLMRARGERTNKGPAKMKHDPFPEVVEVYAARGFRVSFTSSCS
jgi:hypothetical protein